MANLVPVLTGTDGALKSIDANRYATKKTIAQGMLDIALLSANASQLKYVLQVGAKHEFYRLMLTLITISISLQLVVGVLFVVIGGLNINRRKDQNLALILNDVVTVLIFLISIDNCVISGFGIEHSSQPLKLVSQIQPATAGVICIVLCFIDMTKTPKHMMMASVLNNIVLGLGVCSVFCDVLKMNFGFDAAVPVKTITT